MRKGRARVAVVGAASTVGLALVIGSVMRPGGAQPTSLPAQTATTTTNVTPTTCLPVALPTVPSSIRSIVTYDAVSVVSVGAEQNGVTFNVPIGSTFNVELRGSGPEYCVHRTWREVQSGPPNVLRAPDGSDGTLGVVATASFVAVGPGAATISTEAQTCAQSCTITPWSVSVEVRAVSPPAPPNLPRTR